MDGGDEKDSRIGAILPTMTALEKVCVTACDGMCVCPHVDAFTGCPVWVLLHVWDVGGLVAFAVARLCVLALRCCVCVFVMPPVSPRACVCVRACASGVHAA